MIAFSLSLVKLGLPKKLSRVPRETPSDRFPQPGFPLKLHLNWKMFESVGNVVNVGNVGNVGVKFDCLNLIRDKLDLFSEIKWKRLLLAPPPRLYWFNLPKALQLR